MLRAVDGRPAIDATLDDLYNVFDHPRFTRSSLPILGARRRTRLRRPRARGGAHGTADRVDLSAAATDPLLAHGFVYGMVIQHEHQHDETLLATRQLMLEGALPPAGSTIAPGRRRSTPGRCRPRS